LQLSPEKTTIRHITEGFDFLGFNIRQYPAPKTTKRGWKVLIKPSKKSVTNVKAKLKKAWQEGQGAQAHIIVQTINPIIRGWANYFRIGVSKKTFQTLDDWMFLRQKRYAKRMHPNKPWAWRKGRYWGKLNPTRNDAWVFGDIRSGHFLLKFKWFPIQRHIPVKGLASPDDPALTAYWTQREARKVKNLQPAMQAMANRQWRVCYRCGESLFNGEEIHKHHLIPLAEGGQDDHTNIVLVHLYCHQPLHQQSTQRSTHLA
jgi:RNA-directed DNA polymerase